MYLECLVLLINSVNCSLGNNIKGEKFMWKNITDTIGNITTVAVQLIGLSVALEVVFGANVPFLSLGVIDNISSIVASLGNEGLVGLVTIAILWSLWKK